MALILWDLIKISFDPQFTGSQDIVSNSKWCLLILKYGILFVFLTNFIRVRLLDKDSKQLKL